MSRKFTPKVVTANALLEGDVVYLTADDTWTRDHAQAELIEDEAHAQIRLVDASARANEIVGAYLADAVAGENGPEPVHFREAFRTRGPSNYAHGKQAEG
ncbi:DUF2849 domain-containing protein [Psychromarinibacter halotolerans]|uniref:DUF2849 domain-containing protein n=1 Tax=Psychromarinibacter halotolerans TaxID=1775175 RepID=A0ABV7GT94_9RHOB|nr:DUF2849 domain-containing protein [Psychromarinibacter halotolerans]MAQ86447.1 sulfite reductase [Maritimibacter sp.]MDF0599010.1 DUF2849 domain-containing protein [Psychromarinibacter halotolerans]